MRVARRALVLTACLGVSAVPALAGGAPPPPGIHVASFKAPSSVHWRDRAAISGSVAPAAAVPVVIERLAGDAWQPVATTASAANGRFSLRLKIESPGNLRASVQAADGTALPGDRRFVGVARRVTLRVKSVRFENISGRPFLATGVVVPAQQGERVAIEGSVNGRRYRKVADATVRHGRVRTTFTPPSGGRWRFRLVAAPRPGRDSGGRGVSTALDVFPANKHHVPASAPNYLVQQISETILYYYQHGQLIRALPVVFGKPSTPTPVGRFAVYSKTAGPSAAFGPLVLWYHRGYGIHGTNEEYLLSRPPRYYSHGCTRNYNANILWLWPRVPVGTPVLNLG
jgi:lipoprotein-anchoring transpeptidase ErfK/SrfK